MLLLDDVDLILFSFMSVRSSFVPLRNHILYIYEMCLRLAINTYLMQNNPSYKRVMMINTFVTCDILSMFLI